MENEPLGLCVGEPSTRSVEFVSSRRVQLGDYVEIEHESGKVLAFVKDVKRVNRAMGEELEPDEAEKLRRLTGNSSFFRGELSILGNPYKGMEMPRTPPEPGSYIYPASTQTLKKVFGEDDGTKIHIGHLLTRPDVDVFVDIDSIISRHLAVLAVTGGGKSNTVSVILEEILKKSGAILVFDMHGEYINFELKVNGSPVVKRINLTLNPTRLSYYEFRLFANVDDSAYIQDRYLRRAFKETIGEIMEGKIQASEFWGELLARLRAWSEDEAYKEDRKSIVGVINKVEDMMELYSELFDLHQSPIIEQIGFGKLNVIDLSHVDEKIADIVVSHVLRNVLEARKKNVREGEGGLKFPLLTVLEEAHILASSTINTKSRYWISRVAREGRKFGLGLCLVTQRPKALDSNALSQANNMIILRLVEPGDQRHVQQASEALSADLVEQLPSLNVGEALVMGRMIPIPALVKIKLSKAKRGGSDISAVKVWRELKGEDKSTEDDYEEFLRF